MDQNESYPVSDGLSNVSTPVFDPSGKYLYLLASTDAGPVVNWFDQSNQDARMEHSMYLVTLQKETPSPLARENDMEDLKEEKPKEEEEYSTARLSLSRQGRFKESYRYPTGF